MESKFLSYVAVVILVMLAVFVGWKIGATGQHFALLIIVVALAFDYVNGFHDAANSIATIVSTRVLSPPAAVIWAAFFNFVAFLAGTKVADTISKVVKINEVAQDWRLWIIVCALFGAIVWDLITWYYGLPSSSSHALIGGLIGSAIAASGTQVLLYEKLKETVIFIVVSPLLGALLGFFIMVAVMWIFRNWSPGRVDSFFRKGQLVSAALYSFGHGGNDAQKTMGIVVLVLVASKIDPSAKDHVPTWVVMSCLAAISAGTLSGGWRIVHTMGSRITKLKPVGGFSAETAAAASLILATHGGIPVSTTHTITGAIVGVGATRRLSAVRWGVAGSVVWAWILTIPASAAIAAGSIYLVRLFK